MRSGRSLSVPVVAGLAAAVAAGCSSLGYYLQAINGHAQLMHRTRTITMLMEDPEVSASLKQRMDEVLQIRDFATRKLALPDNGSYRSYVRLERAAVLWSLVATPEFSLQPVQWCYPVIGCASYRGYFSEQGAEDAAQDLRTKGLDVAVEPVAAFSTLGWFADPLPSTVLDWPDPQLAGLIFHELAHQRLYVRDDSSFNESFATVVQRAGVRIWLQAQGDQGTIRAWQTQLWRQRAFLDLLGGARGRLAELYLSSLPATALRNAKQVEFDRLRRDYVELAAGWDTPHAFDAWMGRPLNNARLALVDTYERWAPSLGLLLCRAGGDFAAFYRAAEELGELPGDERQRALEDLLVEGSEGQERLRSCP